MKLTTEAFKDGESIPGKYSFCVLMEGTVIMGENINPGFTWTGIPEETKSLTLLCVDSEVPTSAENVNKEGKTVPRDLPRTDFYHWVLIDIPVTTKAIEEGEFSKGITARGKKEKSRPKGKQGLNNYTDWFKGDENMEGEYYGYDGPCPPWNDERIHKYHFILYALDVEQLEVPDPFGGPEVKKAVEGHVLGQAKITGTYTLNKDFV
ncbi:MAG: YbhB/YbcL family Raf kinase inhibitor-like protein [Candidatus Odinarchaeota archaeon]